MSFNAKTIAVSAVALIAAAGGLYAFMPHDREADIKNHAPVTSTPTVAAAKPEGIPAADAKGVNANVAGQPSAPEQPVSQAPKKLTRAQLTPPPETEDEKLQKAAQQESNF